MHAHRVDVFNRAHHDAVIGVVTHQLQFVFLPPHNGLLQEHFVGRRLVEPIGDHPNQLCFGMGKARAQTTHRERRSDDDGIAHFLGKRPRILHRGRNGTFGNIGASLKNNVFEGLAVFASLNRLKRRANQLDPVFLQNAFVMQRHRGVQGRLPTQGGQDGVWFLLDDDLLNHRGGNRFDVGGIGKSRVGHDGRRVGIDQHHPNAVFPQYPAGLGSGVVKLGGLSDHDRAGADDQHRVDVVALWH